MQKLHLSIPEPCHANWQDMTATEQGRFCNACTKQVVDFSMMSDQEVLNYFSILTDEKVCGRALPTQLNREMTRPREPKKRLFWYWNYVAMFFMFFSKSNQVKSQSQVPIKTEQQPNCNNVRMGMMARPQVKGERIIRGKITDAEGKPLAFASVWIKDANNGTPADANGNYSIKAKNGDLLEFSYAGFERQIISVATDMTNLNVTLNKAERMMGDVVFTPAENINTQSKQVCEIKVIDQKTKLPVSKASVFIKKEGDEDGDRSLTDKNGAYSIRKIKTGDQYNITVSAEGYDDNEFTVEGSRTDPRKIIKTIYLMKKPVYKTLDEVVVSAIRDYKKAVVMGYATTKIDPSNQVNETKIPNQAAIMGGVVKGMQVCLVPSVEKKSILKTIVQKIADSLSLAKPNTINLYPNPVRRGSTFIVSLNFQQTGSMVFKIADLTGRIILQKQVITTSKEHLEKIETDGRWPAGVYFLSVFGNNGGQAGRLMNKVSFVVQ